MRKVTWGAAVSLDLYLAGPDEALDWLRWSDDAAAISGASWKGVDTMLMGRKTYEFAAKSGGGGEEARRDQDLHLLADHGRGARRRRAGARGCDRLRARAEGGAGGDIIVMGSGELGSALIEGGVVDEIGFNIHPLLLGGSIPFFRPMARRIEANLIEARPIAKEMHVRALWLSVSVALSQGRTGKPL